MAGAFHYKQIRVRGNHGDRRAQLFDGGERIGRAMDEKHRRAQLREKADAHLFGLVRRMQGIGEQQQSGGEFGVLCGGHRRLPAAVGMSAREDASRRQLP